MKITYKLAKQLKDAGFPQNIKDGGYWYKDDRKEEIRFGEGIVFDKCTYIPTLSELIDACVGELNYIAGSFELTDDSYHTDIDFIHQWGAEMELAGHNHFGVQHEDTREIAVVKLWLELNKK